MLNHAHAELNASLHRTYWMAMRRYVGSTLGRLVDNRPNFILAILVHPDGVGRGRHSAGGHNLDAMGPSAQLLSGSLNAGLHAISDHIESARVSAGTIALVVLALAPQSRIPMASRHREHSARVKETRRADQPILYSPP